MQESLETDLTCLHCMQIFDDPISLIPCGHCYCQKCTDGYMKECSECHKKPEEGGEGKTFLKAETLKTLTGKISFLKQALASLSN